MSTMLKSYTKRLLRFVTIGSVDDGKSTLIGRLLHDAKGLLKDQYEAVESLDNDREGVNFAFFTDGLKKERELGITIDVAYRYFSTPKRKFIIADAPGHFEYTKNMVTACSRAQVAVLLIDARHGLLSQTKRHLFLASLLQVKHVVICINKMDLVQFSEERFEAIKESVSQYAAKLQIIDIQFIPTVATKGFNVVDTCEEMKWYKGGSLLFYLENVHVDSDENRIDCRFPIQMVSKNESPFRYFGRVASGIFKKGDEVLLLPSKQKSKILKITLGEKEIEEAIPGASILLTLDNNPLLHRGDMIVRPNNQPETTNRFNCMLFWLSDLGLDSNQPYYLLQAHRQEVCHIKSILYKLDIETLHREFPPSKIGVNDIARIEIQTTSPLYIDSYQKNRVTGSFILVDKNSLATVAAGVII